MRLKKTIMEETNRTGDTAYDAAVKAIERRRERALNGHANCIPFPFERTSRFFPGIERGTYDIVTASSGIGKSKYTRFMYVMIPYMFIKENPDADIRLKIKYFSLEEDRQKFMLSIISYYLHWKHNMRVSVKQLRSVGSYGYHLPDDVLEKVKEAKEFFSDLEQYIDVIDNVKNPTGIFKHMKTYFEQRGSWTYREFVQDGQLVRIKDEYTPDDPNEYVICITDHIGLLHTEKGMSLWETIGLFSARYCVELRNKYGAIIVNVQQQSAEKEKKQFTFKGVNIQEKLEPSLDGLGDNKTTQRDADNVFGLYAPDRYLIEECDGYKVNILQDHFRLMLILKSRDGEANIRTPLFFDGACGNYVEMPRVENESEVNQVYSFVQSLYNA